MSVSFVYEYLRFLPKQDGEERMGAFMDPKTSVGHVNAWCMVVATFRRLQERRRLKNQSGIGQV
jgi:hypothetical protein